ncbi:oligosaccharide flippase family protein [Gracilimonas mengyeensis]|uniref:Membrane protein involved in the export of O-antigen and teichoic acid n=1 Tax=Gracilimonas mengyeensis TaxID=1302730 RepID=A0A521AGZ9_9BACT|nr:oligosaccharide flippase family protein [Gracilimonas mengyeensis]SMO33980.1 Membrane protein involved in the export of O-antigen and teichoic acid [Gracilimonas mengyeensis]
MAKLKEKAFWILTGDIAGRGLSFLSSIYLARVLGSEFYGLITVAISVLGYATWFSDLGLNSIGTRETAKPPEKRIFRVLEVFRTKLFLGIIVLLLSVSIVYFLDMGSTEKQVILGYLFSIIPYMALLEWFYSGKQEFGKIALSKVLNGGVYFLLVITFVSSSGDVALVPVLYAAGISLAALTLGAFAFREKTFSLPSRGIQVYTDLVKTSSVIGLGKFFAQMVQLLPQLLIGTLLSLSDAGQYGAAFRIIIIAMMIDRVFVNLLLPNLASTWTKNPALATRRISIVYRLVMATGVLIALIFAITAGPVIDILYGAEYQQSVLILQLLSIMIAATFVNSLFSFGLIATNKDKEYFLSTSFGGIISAVLICGFALFGNVYSVAVSVFLSELIITAFTYYWFRKVIPLKIIKPILLTVLPALVLFFASVVSPLHPLLNVFIATFIYLIVIFKSDLVSKEQMSWAKEKMGA